MKLLTVKQVAETLQISASKVYELISRGEIPVYRIGGALRIGERELSEYLESCREERVTRQRKKAVKLQYLNL